MYQTFLEQIRDFIFVEDEPEPADVIFIPGNGYPQMAERAAKLYQEGFSPLILPSGKYSITVGRFSGVLSKKDSYPGPYETEWEFLRDVLMRCGVPEEAILKEDRASYTWENARFSREVTNRQGLEVKKAILCCNACHARRAWMYYCLAFPESQILVCPSSPEGITRNNWQESEEGIEAVTGEIMRIIKQFSLFMNPDSPYYKE